MNEKPECESFKQECGAEPQLVSRKKSLLEHMEVCPPCLSFYNFMLSLDTKMAQSFELPINNAEALKDLETLPQTTSNVSPINKFKFSNLYVTRFKPVFAAAASLMVAALAVIAVQYPVTAIANDVVEHIHHEPDLLILTEAVTSDEKIQMVLNQTNINLADTDLEILSAKLCPLGKQLAAHLVVRGESGPITVLIFPDKKVRSGKIDTQEFSGRILPAKHGTIAVVGGKKETSDHMEKLVLESFQWQG